jgi:hypothetical protein
MKVPMRLSTIVAAGLACSTAWAAAPPAGVAPQGRVVALCSWDHPGRDPFQGDVVAAVDRYDDIPAAVREVLKQRMRERRYDDLVDIRRDSIRGKREYDAQIRDMHFGLDRLCRRVTRAGWSERWLERGLTYCEGEHCILVPTVCRNVSRIRRKDPVAADTLPGPIEPARPAPLASSFAEAVAGADLVLWPADESGLSADDALSPVDEATSSNIPAVPGADVPLAPGVPVGAGGGPPPLVDVAPMLAPPVPEPSTWACLVGGLLALVLALRRQRLADTPRCATQKRS